jgi:hypothetical protein
MKKTTFLISILLLAAIAITACGTSGEDNSAQAAIEVNTSADASSQVPIAEGEELRLREGETPLSMKLALGTFKLEQTEYPIDAEQAGALLPLWKALRSLSESETSAAEELQAVLDQIQDTMTPEQIATIESMDLSAQDMGTIAEEFGLDFGNFAGRFGELSPEMQATMEAARESGQFLGRGSGGGQFPGGRPGGGEGLSGGGERSPEARETAMAERGDFRGAQSGLNPMLLEAVIDFLQGKI